VPFIPNLIYTFNFFSNYEDEEIANAINSEPREEKQEVKDYWSELFDINI
jgi:hypothetical protein